jgi:hypothetical protein
MENAGLEPPGTTERFYREHMASTAGKGDPGPDRGAWWDEPAEPPKDDADPGAPNLTDEEWLHRLAYGNPDESQAVNIEPTNSGLRFVTLDDFVSAEEEGAKSLVGDPDEALIPEDGDVMFYGDGGAGKTTLVTDLAFHLAAGDPWLGIPIASKANVLVVENEGPRRLFRRKLARKRNTWAGSAIEGRIRVLEEPWAELSLADETGREHLARAIAEHKADVVIIGPVTRSGMNEAGTLQEVRDFTILLALVRKLAARPVAFILVHHENKGGKVSGAWEGAGDTLLHVQAQGHGKTRLYIQKARWSSSLHGTTLQLTWAEGEGFTVSDEPERDANTIADELLAAVLANGGASWNTIVDSVPGKRERLREIRDRLLAGGRLINSGGKGGMKLWHADDPARPADQEQLSPGRDSLRDSPESAPGETAGEATESLSPALRGTQDSGTHPVPPSKRINPFNDEETAA